MKNLKLVAMMALCIGLQTIGVTAQEKDKKKERTEQIKITKEKLALSPDQEVKFMEVNKKYGSKMKEINQDTRKEKIRKLKALKSERDAEMKILLSEAQYKSYLQIHEDRKAKRKAKRKA